MAGVCCTELTFIYNRYILAQRKTQSYAVEKSGQKFSLRLLEAKAKGQVIMAGATQGP